MESSSRRLISSPSVLRIQDSGHLRKIFDRYDANQDGKISILELQSLMRCLGDDATVDEVQLIMSTMDLDGEGLISFEVLTGVSKKSTDSTCCTDDLWNAFMVFDKDKNGLISAEELHRLLTDMGEKTSLPDCKAMIKGVDPNGNSAIDFQEFKDMMLTRNVP